MGHDVESYLDGLMNEIRSQPGAVVGPRAARASPEPLVRNFQDLANLLEAMRQFHRRRFPQADHDRFGRRLDACLSALTSLGEDESGRQFLARIDPIETYDFLVRSSEEDVARALTRAVTRGKGVGLDGRSVAPVSPAMSLAYAVCGTPRCGSSLLCKTLAATGLAGDPQEYFWNWRQSVASGYSRDTWVHWTETAWAQERSLADWGDFATELLTRKVGANGVFGVQIMGTYLDELLMQFGKTSGVGSATDSELVVRWLPGCRYVRLVRRDGIRQAVSWVIADQTGVYNSTWPHPPKRVPEFDPWMVDDRCRRIRISEARWDEFFSTQGLEPLTLVYEEFTRDVAGAVLAILDYLEIEPPDGFSPATPSLVKQASAVNDEWVERYLDWRASFGLGS